ncbi:hypothetical protein [Nitrosopumilus sp. S4]
MPATGKVSLTRQTIYCFIPILDLYSAYKIKKLRWFLLVILGLGLTLSTIFGNLNPIEDDEEYAKKLLTPKMEINWEYAILGENPLLSIISIIVMDGAIYGTKVYVIRRWSKSWNSNFQT